MNMKFGVRNTNKMGIRHTAVQIGRQDRNWGGKKQEGSPSTRDKKRRPSTFTRDKNRSLSLEEMNLRTEKLEPGRNKITCRSPAEAVHESPEIGIPPSDVCSGWRNTKKRYTSLKQVKRSSTKTNKRGARPPSNKFSS